jgi:NTP pyrophosphatase (non-canonical NTP hydrolase)
MTNTFDIICRKAPALYEANTPSLNETQQIAHETSRNNGFWDVFQEYGDTPEVLHRFIATQIALIADETFEALGVLRSHSFDAEMAESGHYVNQLPDEFGEELADIIIRTADLAGGTGVDLAGHVARKLEKNRGRPRMHSKNF